MHLCAQHPMASMQDFCLKKGGKITTKKGTVIYVSLKSTCKFKGLFLYEARIELKKL